MTSVDTERAEFVDGAQLSPNTFKSTTKRRMIKTGVAAVFLAGLGTAGWFGVNSLLEWKEERDRARQENEIRESLDDMRLAGLVDIREIRVGKPSTVEVADLENQNCRWSFEFDTTKAGGPRLIDRDRDANGRFETTIEFATPDAVEEALHKNCANAKLVATD